MTVRTGSTKGASRSSAGGYDDENAVSATCKAWIKVDKEAIGERFFFAPEPSALLLSANFNPSIREGAEPPGSWGFANFTFPSPGLACSNLGLEKTNQKSLNTCAFTGVNDSGSLLFPDLLFLSFIIGAVPAFHVSLFVEHRTTRS